MAEWRKIEKELLTDVLKCVETATSITGLEAEFELSETTLKALLEDLKECVDGCDHSVGICMCAEVAIVEELEKRTRGMQTCPLCNGDGFTYRTEHTDHCSRSQAEGLDCDPEHFDSCVTEVPYETKEVRV